MSWVSSSLLYLLVNSSSYERTVMFRAVHRSTSRHPDLNPAALFDPAIRSQLHWKLPNDEITGDDEFKHKHSFRNS